MNPKLPDYLRQGLSLYHKGDYRSAIQVLLPYARLDSNSQHTFKLLAQCHFSLKEYHFSITYLSLVQAYSAPESENYLNLGTCYLFLGDPQTAILYFRVALSLKPNNVSCLLNMAVAHQRLFQHHSALEIYKAALLIEPKNSTLLNNIGNCYKHLGHYEQAQKYLRSAIDSSPAYYEAHRNLSLINDYRKDVAHYQTLQKLYKGVVVESVGRMHLAFALGLANEQQKNYDDAFKYYAEGNKIKRQSISGYSVSSERLRFEKLLQSDSTSLNSACNDQVDSDINSSPIPIFILGMPRSGSTLLETILGLSGKVEPLDELPFLETHIFRYCLNSDGSLDLNTSRIQAVASAYLSDVTRYFPQVLSSGRSFFVDKMPFNFRYANVIARAFPQAKILYTLRDPLDCMVSIYRELFSASNEFSFDLGDIASYTVFHHQLMRKWIHRYPGRIFTVSYEELVSAPNSSIPQICNFIGIPFEASMLHPESSVRSVTTASSLSARSPINTSSIGKWKRFAKHIEPYKAFYLENGLLPDCPDLDSVSPST